MVFVDGIAVYAGEIALATVIITVEMETGSEITAAVETAQVTVAAAAETEIVPATAAGAIAAVSAEAAMAPETTAAAEAGTVRETTAIAVTAAETATAGITDSAEPFGPVTGRDTMRAIMTAGTRL